MSFIIRSQLDLKGHKIGKLDLDLSVVQLDLDSEKVTKRSQLDLDSVVHNKVTIRSR